VKASDTQQRHGALAVPGTSDGTGNSLVAPMVALVNPDGSIASGGAVTGTHGIGGVPFNSADATTLVAVTSAPPADETLYITDLFVSTDTDMSVVFKEETSGTVIAGPFYLGANVPVQFTPLSNQWKTAVATKKLMVQASVAGNITVDVHYNYGS
jgi:hypothetical protein